MATETPGWLSAPEAVQQYRISYKRLRLFVAKGVFTRGNFSTAEERPPIFLRVEELDAFQRGGVAAVAPLKAAYEASISQSPASAAGV